jgi:hypothetical protein
MWGRCCAALAAMTMICGLAAATASAATRYIRADSALASGTCTDPANPCTAAYVLNGGGAIAQNGDTVIALRSFFSFNVGSAITIQKAIELRGEDGGARVPFVGNLGSPVFTLSATGVQLRHLRVQNTNSGSGAVSATSSATIDDTVVDGAGWSLSASGGALSMTDTLLRCGATSFLCVNVSASGNPVTLRRVEVDDTLAPPGGGQGASLIAGTLDVQDSSFAASAQALVASATASGTMRRISVTGRNGGMTVGGPLVISDSVAFSSSSSSALATTGQSTVQLRNVTAVAHGPSSYGIFAGGGINVLESLTPGSTVLARNVIARGDAGDLNTGAGTCFFPPCTTPPPAGAITIDHSNFRTAGGPGTISQGAGNQSADPLFAGAEDFHLSAGSPAIEAGLADALDGPTDLDGNPRVRGAAPDIGAYEATPPAAAPAPAPTSPAADTSAPQLAGLRVTKNGAQVRFSLSEAAKVTVRVNRLLMGRRSGKRCVKATAKLRKHKRCTRHVKVRSSTVTGKVGTNTVKGKALAPGTYEVLLTAVDAAGNKSTKTTKLVVKGAKKKKR